MNKKVDEPQKGWWPGPFAGCMLASYDSALSAFSYLLTLGIGLFSQKESRRIQKYIRHIYRLAPQSSFSWHFVTQCYRHQFAIAFEIFAFVFGWRFFYWQGNGELHQTIDEIRAKQKGYLIVTGHYGNWEFVGHQAAVHGKGTFYALARPTGIQFVTMVMGWVRSRLGIGVLWTDRPRILRDMLKVVGDNDGLGFVMDQKPPSREGQLVEFFGIPTLFVSGPAKLALKANAPVVSVFCERIGPFRYKISHKVVYDGSEDVGVKQLTQRMAAEIESAIKRHPEQWLWNYRRWSDADLEKAKLNSPC